MTLFLDDGDVRLYLGDALETVRQLPDDSVDCVVTSPPYWGLRDYGTGEWDGGDPDCDHKTRERGDMKGDVERKGYAPGSNFANYQSGFESGDTFKQECGKCGARRVDRQMGLEPTPDLFVQGMVELFREIRRVLAPHGTCWVNLGDSYTSGNRDGHGTRVGYKQQTNRGMNGENDPVRAPQPDGLKPKDLVGIPWAVAKALQEPYYTGRITRERDRVWLAATIDAEGSICGFTHERSDGDGTRTGIHITITNTSMPMLAEARRIWPTSRDDGNGHGVSALGTRECRRWIAHNVDDKAALLAELYPYLIAKRTQALLAWNFLQMSREAKRIGKTAEGAKAKERRAWIVAALSDLNHGREVDVPSWIEEPHSLYEPGWYLRSDVIWAKPNPMPESVTDRPTKAHEYVFLLTKQPRYWFDTEAVREPHSPDGRKQTAHIHATDNSHPNYDNVGNGNERWPNGGRNVRSVWQIATQPYPEAHFATFPEELARRCILAGCPTRVCRVCGKPSERIVDVYDGNSRKMQTRRKPEPLGAWLREKRLAAGLTMTEVTAAIGAHGAVNHGGAMSNWEADKNVPTADQWERLKPLLGLGDDKDELLAQWHQWERGEWGTTPDAMTHGAPSAGPSRTTTVETVGWTDCGCNDEDGEPLPTTTNTFEAGWRPGVVLDPFIGSGTTAKAARDHQRHAIGIDLNSEYLELAARRLQQLSLLNAP